MRTDEDWAKVYQAKNALWIHDGNPKRPHALLSFGEHSNGFFNSRLVTCDQTLLDRAAGGLINLFIRVAGKAALPDRVVGPATGATDLATRMSFYVNAYRLPNQPICQWASPEKREGGGRRMVFAEGNPKVLPGENILLCEDVISTGTSVELTAQASVEEGGNVLPFVLVLVNRSGQEMTEGKKIISLVNHYMPKWQPDECLLCPLGSEAIRPKGDNWARLTKKY